MGTLDLQAWLTISVTFSVAVVLIADWARPDITFLVGLGVLLVGEVITPEEAFAGFSNPAVLTVGALFVVAAGVQQTEALGFLDRLFFARRGRLSWTLPRMMLSVAGLSSFLNNTPVVAMLIPRVQRWAHQQNIPASRVLIPLSYAAIVGGMVTLIGTSTNIVVSGLLTEAGYAPLGFFELTWVGLPAMLMVCFFFAVGGYRLLPDRDSTKTVFDQELNDFLFELRVSEQSPLAGKTIEGAELRALGDAYLVHVRRRGKLLPATPEEVLQEGDVLTFTGNMTVFDDLLKRSGLERTMTSGSINVPAQLLYEAVVADSSGLVGKSLKDSLFRESYGGVVLAIHRRSERIDGSLGRVPIKAGDLLLVEAKNGFDKQWNAGREEFYLVAPYKRSFATPSRPEKARVALCLLLLMIGGVATGLIPLVTAAFLAALLMVSTRCLSSSQARRSVDLQVLIIIATALGIGRAVVNTGLSEWLANGILEVTMGLDAVAVLILLYVITNVLTELITHKAAAVLMVPVALAVAEQLGANPHAFAIVVAVSAAASFMTPIGYQTNLMVMAAGSYRFRDYLRVGLPTSLLVMIVAVVVIYAVWL